ncbi:ATP-binding cassette domain-containing protein [Cryptosporangium phraense]|uniref:ATP-binding cassette domain-containing protein n=1 Tax=Cryptosporangium phraense TaxID=2593070 RepID=A0A545APZ8_9ACTN|nr:ATP-binding cassette domain-containing protein [Cryptosporangium phraense]TQS43402.1 ATP-binding cassette domain-containing protein [Cryptosporangium phraense]
MTTATTQVTTEPLRLAGISKHYAGVRALQGVDLRLTSGEVHALLGENGAGKSTLMGIASGSTVPDEGGEIVIDGEPVAQYTPAVATAAGIAIVHQHPAVLPDLTVAENMLIAVPKQHRHGERWMQALLDRVGCTADLKVRVETLGVADRQLLELAKALALEPRVLILDEPTAALGADAVEVLFAEVRRAAEVGTAVVYITHRLAEVRQLADRVTVLRDGTVQGSERVDDITDDEILRMIVGRAVESTFPPKRAYRPDASPVLTVERLAGPGFDDVSFTVRPGEIVGLAGIVGNGQAEVLRALAGLLPAHGTARLINSDVPLGDPVAARRTGVAYLPADRHGEGLLMRLSVRENAAIGALRRFVRNGLVSGSAERTAVAEQSRDLDIRTPSAEAPVSALSGGNQQKVALARALLSEPALVLADEPTQGVDVGARAEIYRILRDVAESGVPVLVVSSDGKELEGLCDRVLVLSRGHLLTELTGDEVTEERMTGAIVTSTTHRVEERPGTTSRIPAPIRRFVVGDYGPPVILALVIALLALYTSTRSDRYFSQFNIASVLLLLAALGFIAMGQLVVVMTGGIDLSVGPLAGFLVVISSFFVNDGKSAGTMVLGLVLMLLAALASGLVAGVLVRFAGFTPVAATLALYIALQGFSLLLRPFQGGYISGSVSDALGQGLGPIPVTFLALVVVAVALEFALRRTRWGLHLRATGSNEESAHRLGIRVTRTVVLAYVVSGALTFFGAILLMAQIGVGDPAQGVNYTLTSVTAVVLGGASLLGGRGSFVGALLGAALIQQILNATIFLDLSQSWQYFFQGLLVLAAAAVYSQAGRPARRRSRAAGNSAAGGGLSAAPEGLQP